MYTKIILLMQNYIEGGGGGGGGGNGENEDQKCRVTAPWHINTALKIIVTSTFNYVQYVSFYVRMSLS